MKQNQSSKDIFFLPLCYKNKLQMKFKNVIIPDDNRGREGERHYSLVWIKGQVDDKAMPQHLG